LSAEKFGEWMCFEHAAGRIRTILFWPSLHEELFAIITGSGPSNSPLSEQLKALLATEHGCSVDTVERAISASRRASAA
jgi:hypothetical protein